MVDPTRASASLDADVVIVGSGAAALTAALLASVNGVIALLGALLAVFTVFVFLRHFG